MSQEDSRRGYRMLSASGLRELMQTHGEPKFELVDVRERAEYEARHLAGARWLPLSELESRLEQIRTSKHTVFYCASGHRAERAAGMAAKALRLSGLYCLEGGLAAWDGEALPAFPRVRVFDPRGSTEDVLLRAMDLEKGAERLYDRLVARFGGTPVEVSLRKLLAAEEAHGRHLHEALTRLSPSPTQDFEVLFGSMKGECLESGESFDDAMRRMDVVPEDKAWVWLELALDMELSAYDLYRSLAVRHHRRALEDVLLHLAAQERVHYGIVLEAIDKLASVRQGACKSLAVLK